MLTEHTYYIFPKYDLLNIDHGSVNGTHNLKFNKLCGGQNVKKEIQPKIYKLI